MATVEVDVIIERPISDVFKAVTNYDNKAEMRQWRSSVKNIGITAGNPLRTGSMIALTKSFMGSETFINMDITDLERNKRVVFKGIHGRFPFTREISFTPDGRNTIVKDSYNVQLSWIWFWYAPFFNGALRNQVVKEWQALKTMLEKNSYGTDAGSVTNFQNMN